MGSKLGPLRSQLQDKYGIRAVRIAAEHTFIDRVVRDIDPTMGGRGAITALTKWLTDPVLNFLFTQVSKRSMCAGRTHVIALAPDDSVGVALEAA